MDDVDIVFLEDSPFEIKEYENFVHIQVFDGVEAHFDDFKKAVASLTFDGKLKSTIFNILHCERISDRLLDEAANLRQVAETSKSLFRLLLNRNDIKSQITRSKHGNVFKFSTDFRHALIEAKCISPSQIESQFAEPFRKSIIKTLEVQSGTQAEVPQINYNGEASRLFMHTASIDIEGNSLKGMVILTASNECLHVLIQRMMRREIPADSPSINLSVCEYLNVFVGYAKTELNGLGYEMEMTSHPVYIPKDNHESLGLSKDYLATSFPIKCDAGDILLEIRLLKDF